MASGEFKCDSTNFRLTEAMVTSYKELGYFLVREFLSPSEITKVKEAVEHERYTRFAFYTSGPDGEEGESRKVMWRHPGNDVTGMLARCDKVAGTCEKVLGGEVYHYHTKLMTKAARTGWEQFWHQDYGYWYKNGCLFPDMMSVFLPLDSCTRASGCLEVLESSHKLGRIGHDLKDGQTGADLERVQEIKKVCPHKYLPMEPGDALFFHCNLLHASGRNVSEKKRWALIPCYNRRSNNPCRPHHHPCYTPLQRVPDSAILACDVDDLSGKEFNTPGNDVTAQ